MEIYRNNNYSERFEGYSSDNTFTVIFFQHEFDHICKEF